MTNGGEAEATGSTLGGAVHRAPALSAQGLLERGFTAAFSGLVYPQIWEDPEIDAEGLALGPGKRIFCIGSGGCNVMSYLVTDPDAIVAVDLNRHHVHLLELKLLAARHMPTHQGFFAMFGEGEGKGAVSAYYRHLRPKLPGAVRAYWEVRDWRGRRRVSLFERGLYRQGLLGTFIGAGHFAARRLGVELEHFLEATTLEEQRDRFDRDIAPLFDSKLVQALSKRKETLFGLGIPPAQYESLARAGNGDMALVLKARLRKLLCDFPLSENWFAWQALARRYPPGDGGPLPPYLRRANWEAVKARAGRATIEQASMTDRLAREAGRAFDAYAMLDSQDWMTDDQLNLLWDQIARTARTGARVLFRTADVPSLLPGRLREDTLSRFAYLDPLSRDLTARDRSAIYGGVHVYEFQG